MNHYSTTSSIGSCEYFLNIQQCSRGTSYRLSKAITWNWPENNWQTEEWSRTQNRRSSQTLSRFGFQRISEFWHKLNLTTSIQLHGRDRAPSNLEFWGLTGHSREESGRARWWFITIFRKIDPRSAFSGYCHPCHLLASNVRRNVSITFRSWSNGRCWTTTFICLYFERCLASKLLNLWHN